MLIPMSAAEPNRVILILGHSYLNGVNEVKLIIVFSDIVEE